MSQGFSPRRSLDLTGPLLLGGVPNLPENFPVSHRDFVGCMRDLYIDNKRIDLASYIANNGTTAGTNASALPCPGSSPRSPCACTGEGLDASSACLAGRREVTGRLKLT